MKSFKIILKEQLYLSEARGVIAATGFDTERHEKQYVTPHLGSKEYTHTLATQHEDIPVGSKLKLHKAERRDGKLYIHATDENTRKKSVIPANKIRKPGEQQVNKGNDYERNFVERLKKHGLMHGEAAGFSAGNDFNLINKKTGEVHKGSVLNESVVEDKKILQGETKLGKTAAFGQLTIALDDKKGGKGWHIPESNRRNRPKYAKQVLEKGILEHMNKYHKKIDPNLYRQKEISFDHENMKPANEYLQDHHVQVLQVGKHGTYKVGKKDATGHGLPELKGKGKFRVYQKTGDPKKRMIMFKASHIEKSHVDLDEDEHLHAMAKTLGHRNINFKKTTEE
jgi:hypothetical protein